MSHYSHNFDQIRPAMIGFGQHISAQPREVKAERIALLKQTILDASRELEQLLAEEGGDGR
ncbi:Uncharacterised protein [Mycobacteroides abscessus subsp. abscessus]|nr:Uncharacterised protein [Mycobacteroides abscessus subsp. abscessus]